MKNPKHITTSTAFPWTVTRSFKLEDGTLIDDVRIVAEDKHFADGGDWYIDLGEPRFADLDDDQQDEAMDMASDILSEIANNLNAGVAVPIISKF